MNLSLQVWSCHSASCIAARAGRVGGHVIDLLAILAAAGLVQRTRSPSGTSACAGHAVLRR